MIDNVDWILIGNLFFIENCSMGRHRLSCRQGHCPLDAFLDEVHLQSRLGRYGFCYGHRVCGQLLLFVEDNKRLLAKRARAEKVKSFILGLV